MRSANQLRHRPCQQLRRRRRSQVRAGRRAKDRTTARAARPAMPRGPRGFRSARASDRASIISGRCFSSSRSMARKGIAASRSACAMGASDLRARPSTAMRYFFRVLPRELVRSRQISCAADQFDNLFESASARRRFALAAISAFRSACATRAAARFLA